MKTTTTTKRKQATTTASKRNRKQAQPAPAVIADTANPAEIITAENVQSLGERIAVRALKTYYQKSGEPFIYTLYCGIVADITEHKKAGAPLSDGYDIAQTASAFLCEYIGKTVQDTTTDGQTDKDGQPVSILRACFRAVNRYIKGERRHDFKRVYVDEVDTKTGETLYYEIPDGYDLPTVTDYKQVAETIEALNLTARQAQILRYRLRGYSVHQIADKMSIHRKTLQEHIKAIQRKYTTHKQAQPAHV